VHQVGHFVYGILAFAFDSNPLLPVFTGFLIAAYVQDYRVRILNLVTMYGTPDYSTSHFSPGKN